MFLKISLVLSCLIVISNATQCGFMNSQGITYDFSALVGTSDYYLPKNPTSLPWDVYMNLCVPDNTQICGAGVAGCMVWDPNSRAGHASLGTVASLSWSMSPQGNPVASFAGGDMDRQFSIEFPCDQNTPVGVPIYQGESPAKQYNFIWPNVHSCVGPSPSCAGTDCLSCTKNNCHWIQDYGYCTSNLNPSASSIFSSPKFCPPSICAGYSKCRDCTEVPGCVFCLESSQCQPKSNSTATCKNFAGVGAYCGSN